MARQTKKRAPKRKTASKKATKKQTKSVVDEVEEDELEDADATEQQEEKKQKTEEVDEKEVEKDEEAEDLEEDADSEVDDEEQEESDSEEDDSEDDDSDDEEDDTDEDSEKNLEENADAEREPDSDEVIHSIYNLDDEEIDLTTMDQHSGRRWWILGALVIVVGLVAAAWYGFQAIANGGAGGGEVRFDIEAEDKIASGDVVTLEVTFENTKEVALEEASIELFYPEGFRYHSATVDADDKHEDAPTTWSFDDVAPGAAKRVKITGQLVGSKGEEKKVRGLLNYQPENFSQLFQESAEMTIEITSSIVEVEVEAPSQIQSDQEFTYAVKFTNTSATDLDRVQVEIEEPAGFTRTAASLDPSEDDEDENPIWSFDTLEAGSETTIELTGVIEGDSGDTMQFVFQLGLLEIDNTVNTQVEKSSLIVVVNPSLSLEMSAPESVEAGEEIELTATVKNESEAVIEDLQLKLELDGVIFGDDTEHVFDAIDTLAPSSEETLVFTTTVPDDLDGSNPTGSARLYVDGASVDGNTISFEDETTVNVAVKGTAEATVEARYFDENLRKIGSGPIPPQVGSQTNYIVFWTITNGSNDLENASLTTTLPDDVIWVRDASSGVEYDSENRLVSYSAEELEAGDVVELSFAVGIAPTESDLDSLMVLTHKTNFRATDSASGEKISDEFDRLTTALPNDEGATGSGVVVSNKSGVEATSDESADTTTDEVVDETADTTDETTADSTTSTTDETE